MGEPPHVMATCVGKTRIEIVGEKTKTNPKGLVPRDTKNIEISQQIMINVTKHRIL